MQIYEGLEEILATEEFLELIRRIEAMAVHHERKVLEGAANQPVESIRYSAGRVNGIRLVLDMLLNARKEAKSAR